MKARFEKETEHIYRLKIPFRHQTEQKNTEERDPGNIQQPDCAQGCKFLRILHFPFLHLFLILSDLLEKRSVSEEKSFSVIRGVKDTFSNIHLFSNIHHNFRKSSVKRKFFCFENYKNLS